MNIFTPASLPLLLLFGTVIQAAVIILTRHLRPVGMTLKVFVHACPRFLYFR